MEVKGLEPSASTLRKCGSRRFDQALSYDSLVAALRSPQLPSRSLPFPPHKVTYGHAGQVLVEPLHGSVVTFDRGLSQCRANDAGALLTTITFCGERQDINPAAFGDIRSSGPKISQPE